MPIEVRDTPIFRASISLDGNEGQPGEIPISRGTGLTPVYGRRVEFIKSTTVPTDPVDGLIWFNPDTGIRAEYIVTASGGKWVELVAPGVAYPSDPPLITAPEYIAGSETALRSVNPVVLTDAINYYFFDNIESGVDATLGRVATGARFYVGDYELVAGSIITETVTVDSPLVTSLQLNLATETNTVFTIPIAGDFTFTFNTTQIAAIRTTDYTWKGTIRFSYTSGNISFFVGTTGYTITWEEGTQPIFETGRTYVIGITVNGPSSEIRLYALSGVPKVTGTVRITVGTTPPASPAVNDLWIDTN